MLQGATRARGLRDVGGDADYVRRLLATAPVGASIEQDVLSIERSAEEQGVEVRSRSALRRLVREFRQQDAVLPLADAPSNLIAVDMVPIEIAVEHRDAIMLPLATLIIHPRSATVLSAMLTLGVPSPDLAAAALVRWIERLPADDAGTRIEHVLIPGTREAAWSDLFRVFERHGIDRQGPDGTRVPAGTVVGDAIGRRVLDLDVRPRMVHRRSEERRPLRRSSRVRKPLSIEEAQAAVDERIAATMLPDLRVARRDAIVRELRMIFDL